MDRQRTRPRAARRALAAHRQRQLLQVRLSGERNSMKQGTKSPSAVSLSHIAGEPGAQYTQA